MVQAPEAGHEQPNVEGKYRQDDRKEAAAGLAGEAREKAHEGPYSVDDVAQAGPDVGDLIEALVGHLLLGRGGDGFVSFW